MGLELFYKMAQVQDITVTHAISTGASRAACHWLAINIDCGSDQHAFARLSLLKEEETVGKVQYVVWHFKRHDSNGASVGVMECELPNEIWDPALASNRF
jgi:hypothetical protein